MKHSTALAFVGAGVAIIGAIAVLGWGTARGPTVTVINLGQALADCPEGADLIVVRTMDDSGFILSQDAYCRDLKLEPAAERQTQMQPSG